MNQKSIRYPVSIQGIGLHTGDTCTVKLSPSLPNTGITFYLDSSNGKRMFYSDARKIVNPILSTNIGDDVCSVSTIEHLMACLHVMGIDNLKITVSGDEIPILDGSGRSFWNILKAAEPAMYADKKKFKRIHEPYEYSFGNSSIYAEPYEGLEVKMKIDFDHPAIGIQEMNFEMYTPEHRRDFERRVVSARTFGIMDQIIKAKEQGLIKGGTLENAIVLDEYEVINTELRMVNEFVAHKLLDFLGDIYISGPILGFFDVCCTSHQMNNHMIKSIYQELN